MIELFILCYIMRKKSGHQECFVFKGSVWLDMLVELRMQYCGKLVRVHLKPMRRFYGAYLFNKSANSIFNILLDCSFHGGIILRIFFFKSIR